MVPPSFELIVDRDANGVRIDTFLERQFRNYTSWRLQRIVRAGGATIDYALADERDRVYLGQRVAITLLEPPDKLLPPEPREVPVLFEDAWIWVVDKPAGLIAHPAGEYPTGSLANVLQHRLDERTAARGLMRPGIVHRLDRQTSGLMVVALNYVAHRGLAACFETSRVAKTYVAIVDGLIGPDSGVLDLPIGRTPTGRQVLMSCRADALDRRPAKTHFKVLRRFDRHTLVVARPVTGRNHQIRVHFAHIGHPLLGDEFYEAHGAIKPLRPRRSPDDTAAPDEDPSDIETGYALRRHALHAIRLEFPHPVSGLWLEFQSRLPDDFRATLDQMAFETGAAREPGGLSCAAGA
ncbi:MAG: RluA family pseudouridine synthase [Planctomyces sp.]|nr:RluA family pseudouridine synthase [Planctomyces sp.]